MHGLHGWGALKGVDSERHPLLPLSRQNSPSSPFGQGNILGKINACAIEKEIRTAYSPERWLGPVEGTGPQTCSDKEASGSYPDSATIGHKRLPVKREKEDFHRQKWKCGPR
jgi:hypothetical protein